MPRCVPAKIYQSSELADVPQTLNIVVLLLSLSDFWRRSLTVKPQMTLNSQAPRLCLPNAKILGL